MHAWRSASVRAPHHALTSDGDHDSSASSGSPGDAEWRPSFGPFCSNLSSANSCSFLRNSSSTLRATDRASAMHICKSEYLPCRTAAFPYLTASLKST